MDESVSYHERMPVKSLDISTTDLGITIKLLGFSGDCVRTCIYYEIEENSMNYCIQEAFLIDDKERAYCLVSVEKKGLGLYSSWMEFGPIPADTLELELHVTLVHQSPTSGDFKIKGRTFVDPWDPEFPLSSVLIDKIDQWLGGVEKTSEEDDVCQWGCRGEWNFLIPLGVFEHEHFDRIKKLDFCLSLGKEVIRFKEFRNSNTGSFIIYEVSDESLRQLGDRYKKILMDEFSQASHPEEFYSAMADMGLNMGYVPISLNLQIRCKERNMAIRPAYSDSRGIIQNRIYNFFDECMGSRELTVEITDILNLKLDTPLESEINIASIEQQGSLALNIPAGDLNIRGELVFLDIPSTEDYFGVSYMSTMLERVEGVIIRDSALLMENEEGELEEYPTLGSFSPWDGHCDRKPGIRFPAIHRFKDVLPDKIRIVIYGIDIKLKEPIVFPFDAGDPPPGCPMCGPGKKDKIRE